MYSLGGGFSCVVAGCTSFVVIPSSGLSVSVDAGDMHLSAEVADAAVGDSPGILSAFGRQ